jgi:hypothetical protein
MNRLVVSSMLALFLAAPTYTQVKASRADLPPAVLMHLRQLEETYRVLDVVALKVWPGWTAYRDTPFLLDYPNGLRVMVGHPNPPAAEFEPVEGVQVENRKIAIDRRRLVPLALTPPLSAGGGPIPYGMTAGGQPVQVVHMSYRVDDTPPEAGDKLTITDNQILTYIHELFHCFQRTAFAPARFGNLRFNADTTYAVWSEVEGLALEAAYLEKDDEQARERLKDFIVAREVKRRNMTEMQRGEESADDVREGTAVYSTVRTLEALRGAGFNPGITREDDPYYGGFRDIDTLLKFYFERLRASTRRVEDPKMKCYDYGSFQCLLAERLFQGWQDQVAKGAFIDAELARRLAMEQAERVRIEERLKDRYRTDEIRGRVAATLDPRDAAWKAIQSRKGRVYVVDVKAAGEYIDTIFPAKAGYHLGIGRLFPDGADAVKFNDVEISRVTVPFETAQLYYVRLVDTVARKGGRGFTIAGEKQADGSYIDATVTTPLFTLKAPRVRVIEGANLIKIKVLSRVRGG